MVKITIDLYVKEESQIKALLDHLANTFMPYHWDAETKSIEGGCTFGLYKITRSV